MKLRKLLALILVMALACLSLVACGGSKDPIVGTWKAVSIEANGQTMELEKFAEMVGQEFEASIEVKSDGTAILSVTGEEDQTANWKADGDSYVFTGDGEESKITLEDDVMKITVNGMVINFKK